MDRQSQSIRQQLSWSTGGIARSLSAAENADKDWIEFTVGQELQLYDKLGDIVCKIIGEAD